MVARMKHSRALVPKDLHRNGHSERLATTVLGRIGHQPPTKLAEMDVSSQAAWNEWVDSRIAVALAAERRAVLEGAGEAIRDLLDEQRATARDELADEARKLRIELCETQTVVAELRQLIASEKAHVIEPNPMRRVN